MIYQRNFTKRISGLSSKTKARIVFAVMCVFPLTLSLLNAEQVNAATVNAQVSRTGGVAPLAIHFTADIRRSSATERSFHDLDYTWDFGDPSSGVWANSSKSKNQAKGPVAAHVFEKAGSFAVSLKVTDQSGSVVAKRNFNIKVSAPDIYFAGTRTTCITSTVRNDFSGCPAGANRIVTDNLAETLPAHTDINERVLLNRGASWTIHSTPDLPDNEGPVQISAYGECLNRDKLGICGNDPRIRVGDDAKVINLNRKQFWTISNISFIGGKSHSPIWGAYRFHDILLLRLKTSGFDTALGWSHWNNYPNDNLIENMSIVECSTADTIGMQIYIGAEKLAYMGNIAKNSKNTHILRVWQGYLGVISHNVLSGSSMESSKGRHALKFHGPGPTSGLCQVAAGNGCLENRSEFTVVSDNVFGGSGPSPVNIGPQDSGKDERVSDVLFENNYIVADYGKKGAFSDVQVGVLLWGRYFTVKNNVIDLSEGYPGNTGIYVSRRGVEWSPVGHRIYNNTIYRRDRIVDSNTQVGIKIHNEAEDIEVRNNLVSFTAANKQEVLIKDESGKARMSNNLMTASPYLLDPDNTSSLKRNFSLTSRSTRAINHGCPVPVYTDFLGNRRSGEFDIGAFNYGSGSVISAFLPAILLNGSDNKKNDRSN